ncbi:BRO-like protein [Armadillidium vulgare iridescent virus]|uniref:BRO-like protein n=1 Tax=Armadillidium vulgare iridescent virus TaxID=72201 RepID=A0A068QL35_9VIRU|nr:BRO-like protein [Armadillidium vulgare iridescent virus]CCV02430.1 BRO-like protein [Armadillidium vulgare iridescent virus]
MELGFVYVISTNTYISKNIYKIGCTKNLERRLKTMNATRLYDDRFFIKMFWETKNYFDLETGIHNLLKEYRQNNEFFNCSFEKIEEAVEQYLSGKSTSYIHHDAILFPARERNTKWFPDRKCFEIDTLETKEEKKFTIMMNEERMREEIKTWISPFDKHGMYRFAHGSFWDSLIYVLKKNFLHNEDEDMVVNEVDEEDLKLLNQSFATIDLDDFSTEISELFSDTCVVTDD